MKDFASAAPGKKRSRARHKTGSKSPNRLLKFLLVPAVFMVLVVLFLVLLRSLSWSAIFPQTGQQTVLFTTQKVDQRGAALVQFLFDEQRIEVFPIDVNSQMEVMGGYGVYRFQAVYPLLALEGKVAGYIRSAFSLSMGTLLDQLWLVNDEQLELNDNGQLVKLMLKGFWTNTQVPIGERMALLSLALDHNTEFDQHQTVNSLPADEFTNLKYATNNPNCTIALLNTTSMNGLAGRVADLLESHNFRVVRTINDDTGVERTTVVFTKPLSEDCQLVMDKMERLVPGGIETQADNDQALHYRADVVVKLGTDLVQ